MKKFNLRQEVREFAKQHPDVKYVTDSDDPNAMCFYTKGECTNGTKGCIYGQVLSKLGYKELLESIDGEYRSGENFMPTIKDVITKHLSDPLFEHEELSWHELVQSTQDDGVCWGDAVELADEYENL